VRIGKWTLKELVNGHAIKHPTHPMLVHFPIALYPAAVVLGLISRVTDNPTYGRAGAYLLVMGVAGALVASVPGFVDWFGMMRGSVKRRTATRHMVIQLAATLLAVEALVLYFREGVPSIAAVGVLVVACVTMFVGNFLGGILVYRLAMRVSIGAARAAEAASPAPTSRVRTSAG
jgi:uncharacterized membrane protein